MVATAGAPARAAPIVKTPLAVRLSRDAAHSARCVGQWVPRVVMRGAARSGVASLALGVATPERSSGCGAGAPEQRRAAPLRATPIVGV